MKRIISLLLCLALMLGGAALAENAGKTPMGTLDINGVFHLQCAMPEGYTLMIYEQGSDHLVALVSPVNGSAEKPSMSLSIYFDDLLSEVQRLNDLDESALAQIEATFAEEETVSISYMETEHGTKLMVVRESGEETDYVDFYTIYMGYQLEFVLYRQTDSGVQPITEEDIQMAVRFLSDLDFVPAE